MNNVFRESERDPAELCAVAWGKMDQAKTIIPRIKQLANTHFVKGGARLVVSLMGVLAPGLWRRPLFYTVLEDQKHGADMVASIMLDVLLEASRTLGQLPRRFFVQADNTAKETKNTITFFAATWLPRGPSATKFKGLHFAIKIRAVALRLIGERVQTKF